MIQLERYMDTDALAAVLTTTGASLAAAALVLLWAWIDVRLHHP